jgi:hypothetical protein
MQRNKAGRKNLLYVREKMITEFHAEEQRN